jgi:prophage antirepressor-like protein
MAQGNTGKGLTPYSFEGRNIRLVRINEEPWFVASDAAAILGYAVAKDLTRTLDEDEKGRHTVPTPGGDQELLVISEAGLYRAIVQRRATTAVSVETREGIARFQRWVFHDVLPAIRQYGSYTAASAKAPTVGMAEAREARLMHKHLMSIGKIAGLKGNQLLIAANAGTRKCVGFDVLGSMGLERLLAPDNDPLVIPSKIGADLGVSAIRVNSMTQEIGLQVGDRDHKNRAFWKLTEAGEKFGGVLVDRERSNGTGQTQQIMWPTRLIEVLREHMGKAS